jgi:beta-glucosidase
LSASVSAPPKKLAGWARVHLEPGERKSITVTLNPQLSEHPLSFWSAGTQSWEIANGAYTVQIGASSQDIRLTGDFHIRSFDSNTAK